MYMYVYSPGQRSIGRVRSLDLKEILFFLVYCPPLAPPESFLDRK